MFFIFFVAALSETLYYNVKKESSDVITYERYDVDTCYMTKNAEYFKITVASNVYTRSYFNDADCKTAGTTDVETIDFTATTATWMKTVDAKYTKEVAFTAETKSGCPNKDKKMTGVYNNDVCYKVGTAYKRLLFSKTPVLRSGFSLIIKMLNAPIRLLLQPKLSATSALPTFILLAMNHKFQSFQIHLLSHSSYWR
ncbi:hypothetical protein EIN_148580 [Entamoeba invadens IP1]|uniref:Lipocalin n=1 Tax=Entamoeba invadens IP1 TaxID=370355 RepID=L7FKK8_ENTIV|nr:hypothetical protein EIN_148580 [Entamoeba invadens IP1]ELP85536.1 hypothetical protein EIN_148580 [Entamoeba invadens IP1]|eukprot:XP_004184882.1 hypothetical protein EIN_148580 [Entamoeba invadens IP1]